MKIYSTTLLFLFALVLPYQAYSQGRGGALLYENEDSDELHFVNPYSYFDNKAENAEDEMSEVDESEFDTVGSLKRGHIDKMNQEESAVKKDLIQGPSFTPKINEHSAGLDIESENIDVKGRNEDAVAKRKDSIAAADSSKDSEDNDIQGTSLNDIQNDILTARSTFSKQQARTDNDTNKRQQYQETKNLIKLLYDFKGKTHDRAGHKHLSDTEPEDDLMDLEGLKNTRKDTLPKISKEKIDVTINVNLNEPTKASKKKKSKVENQHHSSLPSPLKKTKMVDEAANKRSHVNNKDAHENHKVEAISDDDEDDDDDNDDDEHDKANDRSQQNNLVTSTNTRAAHTLAHLKALKTPLPLMNQLKEKIEEEAKEDEDEEENDDNDDDESGSGSEDQVQTEKETSKVAPTPKKNRIYSPTKKRFSSLHAHAQSEKSEEEETAAIDVKVNKVAATKKEKENEMEHNDNEAESVKEIHAKSKVDEEEDKEKTSIRSETDKEENVEKMGNNEVEKEEAHGTTKSTVKNKSNGDMTLEEVRAKFKSWQHKQLNGEKGTNADDESETRSWKEEKNKLLKKLKNPLIEAKETADITKSADEAFSNVVNTVTTPSHVQELRRTQEKDVKEVAASAEKAFATVVDNVMKGKGGDISLSHHALTKSATELITNAKDAPQGSNLKKLLKFKAQILGEIKKINNLQKQYGPNAKGSTDLIEARSVLEKDLKVVNELERRLKSRHGNKQAEVVHHDQKAFGKYAQGQAETIPEDTLGFSSEEQPPVHSKKSKPKYHKGGKIKAGKKSKSRALEEIQSLLKAEIKRLKSKKNGKPDPQLNNIRKLVQRKLKGFLKNGNLDKNAFKKLSPEIKELGTLLKQRIKNAKGYYDTNADFAATHGFAPDPVTHKGVSNELEKVKDALSATDQTHSLKQQSQTLQAAQNALSRIQSSNISLLGGESNKMKSLLTSLNAKLGKMFNHNSGYNGMQSQSQANSYGQPTQQQQQQQQQSQQLGTSNSQLQQIQGMNAAGQNINVPSSFVQNGYNYNPTQPAYQPKSPYQAQALAKAETPLPDFGPDETKPMADDEPVDTLIEALERDITEVWSYRDQFPNADSLGLDNEKVHNAYANLGSLSGLSLRRALDRALRGEDVGLAIVGGSISKGGPFSEKGLDFVLKAYFYAIEDYWNKIIRPVTGSSLIVRDCSIGGISTDYYSFCLRSHLPDDEKNNIVIWELSANDMKRYEDAGKERTQPLEQFTRNVLSYRAKPALLFVNFFANFEWDPDLAAHCRNFEDEGGDDIAKYYKITSLSWRNMVCPEIQAGSPLFTREKLFAEDKFHPSIQGHAQVAYLIIDYVRTEFLKNLVKMRTTNIADAVTRLQIPKSIYVPRPLFKETVNWKPLCYTYMLVDEKQPNNTLLMDASPSGSFHSSVVRAFKIRSDKIAGMNTVDKDQYVRFSIHLPAHPGGGIQPYKKLGIMSFTDNRKATVQFDAEPSKVIETGKRFLEGTTIKYVATDIRPGEHQLTVRSGDNGFLVSAIVVG